MKPTAVCWQANIHLMWFLLRMVCQKEMLCHHCFSINESTANEHSLFNRICFSQALTTLYDSLHMNVSLSRIPAVMRQWVHGLSPLCQPVFYFPMLQGHNKEFSQYIYHKVPQINHSCHDKTKYFLWKTQFTYSGSVAK